MHRELGTERYERRVEQYRLPNSQDKRLALVLQTGADGFVLLDVLNTGPVAAGKVPMVQTLPDV